VKFADLGLSESILRAVAAEGYTTATPVQAQSIPKILAGSDLVGCAQTGTGKTAAFALPILHRMAATPGATGRGAKARCLVLAPTRELATQIATGFRVYGKNLPFRTAVIFGGVNQHSQVQALRGGLDIIVATPGRLLDLMNQGHVDLRNIQTLVLDEADRMLDMGFIHDIRKIVSHLPKERQTLLFSATMPSEIRRLSETMMRNPVGVQISPVVATADGIEESVYFVEKRNKPALLAHLFKHLPMSRAIVFTRTKHGADKVVRQLHDYGIRSEALHGNKSQNARQRALENFRSSRTPLLIATDIASRGIDIDGISHVVNFDVTHEPETYVHRIGRTARAGALGAAVSFCDREERSNLKGIERLIRRTIPVITDQPAYLAQEPTPLAPPKTGGGAGHSTARRGGSRGFPSKAGGGHPFKNSEPRRPAAHAPAHPHTPRPAHAPPRPAAHTPRPAAHTTHAPRPAHAPAHAAHPAAHTPRPAHNPRHPLGMKGHARV
jgi:ATP-dependent RNA helicase RhlE